MRLLNGLDRPLAVAPAGFADRSHRLRTIGVGFDGSPESRAALQAAARLARHAGAEVEVIGVAVPHADLTPNPWAFAWGAGAIRDDLDERMRGRVESAAGGLPHDVRHSTQFHTGTPADVLVDAADELDLLVVGSRGYGPIAPAAAGIGVRKHRARSPLPGSRDAPPGVTP